MGQVIPKQHPAVVLRAHYDAVRALLVAALVAIVALAATVVILAEDDLDSTVSIAPKSAQVLQPGTPDIRPQALPPGTRFDGGPDEGTRAPQSSSSQQAPVPPVSSQGPGARP